MVAIQIRDVPDQVRETLAENASRRGQSLQSYLLNLVTDEASRSANLSMLSRFSGRSDGSSLSVAELDVAVAQERARHDDGAPVSA